MGEGNNIQYNNPNANKSKIEKEVEEEYNPLKIPADWEFARKHALARSVGHPVHSSDGILYLIYSGILSMLWL